MRQTEVGDRNDGTSEAALNGATPEKTLKITRIAHSCTLLDFGGSIFLADPGFHKNSDITRESR